jgi:hypothetical protein
MNDPIKDYMGHLRSALRSLPDREQEKILLEVETHLLEGLSDSRLGVSPEERSKALMREMGNPEELGYELKQLSRRQRWLDFLLAVIPALLFTEIIEVIVKLIHYPSVTPPFLFNEVSLAILPLCVIMLLVARRRASEPLLIFWLLITLDTVLSGLHWSAVGRPQLPFALFWVFTAFAILAWLLVVFWRIRQIPLLMAFGSLPLLLKFAGMPAVLEGMALIFSVEVSILGDVTYYPPLSFAGILLLTTLLTIIALALLFVSYRRPLRWLGLGLFVSAPTLANALFFGLNGAGSLLIVVVPVTVLVITGGMLLEQFRKSSLSVYSR